MDRLWRWCLLWDWRCSSQRSHRFLGNRQSSKRCIFEALFRGIVMLYFYVSFACWFLCFFFSSLSGWLVGCLMSVAELCCFCCGYCCCLFLLLLLLLLLLPFFFLFLLLSVSLVFALVVHFCLCFATLGWRQDHVILLWLINTHLDRVFPVRGRQWSAGEETFQVAVRGQTYEINLAVSVAAQ